jgi:hypothetical protein
LFTLREQQPGKYREKEAEVSTTRSSGHDGRILSCFAVTGFQLKDKEPRVPDWNAQKADQLPGCAAEEHIVPEFCQSRISTGSTREVTTHHQPLCRPRTGEGNAAVARRIPTADFPILDFFCDGGIDVLLETNIKGVAGRSGQEVRLSVDGPAGRREIQGTDILIAAGGTPNSFRWARSGWSGC